MMRINQFEVWIADLNPKQGSEPGKKRPVVIVQTNLLNKLPHPSTLICPVTTNIKPDANLLRVHLDTGTARLSQPCDIMMDQLRAIDNRRLVRKLGLLPADIQEQIKENLMVVLDLSISL